MILHQLDGSTTVNRPRKTSGCTAVQVRVQINSKRQSRTIERSRHRVGMPQPTSNCNIESHPWLSGPRTRVTPFIDLEHSLLRRVHLQDKKRVLSYRASVCVCVCVCVALVCSSACVCVCVCSSACVGWAICLSIGSRVVAVS